MEENENIYKISYSNNNEILKIYVFLGLNTFVNDDKTEENISELFSRNPTHKLFKNIFNTSELEIIKDKNIQIKFCNEKIHLDDTIETIKKKIIKEFDTEISFEEIYLFYKKQQKINSISIYHALTQNDKILLNKENLVEYLLNIDEFDLNKIPDKDVYTYEDILNLNLEETTHLVNKPFGQKLISLISNYPYTVNPYNVITYDVFLEKYSDKLTTTSNNNLMLNYGDINLNMIYLCLAKDTLNYSVTNELSELTTIKLYYPFLFNKNIVSLEQLDDKRIELISNTKSMLTTNFTNNNNNIDLFYNIYHNKNKDLNYNYNGIKYINFTIHPKYTLNLPIHTIFKLFNSSELIPFIKFNPSKKQEKIYRLFCDKMSTNNKKIPLLNKGTIFKVAKQIGRQKGLSMYIEKLFNDNNIPIIFELYSNGDINVQMTFKNIIEKYELESFIKDNINPIIINIKNILEQSEISLNVFDNFMDESIEILDLHYELSLPIKKKIQLKKYISCMSSIFSILENDIDKGINMRYKKVAYYNEVDGKTALIIELINKNNSVDEIIEELKLKFSLSDEDAKLDFSEIVSNLGIEQNAHQNKNIKIKDNPGFLTTMNMEKFKNNIILNVEGINNFKYLNVLFIYIDSLLRILCYPDTTNISEEVISSVCKKKVIETEEEKVADIVAPSELPYKDSEDTIKIFQQAQEINFNEDETVLEEPKKNILDFLLDIEDEEEDEEGMMGGVNSEEEEERKEEINIPKATIIKENVPNAKKDKPKTKTKKNKVDEREIDEDDEYGDITGLSLNKPNPFFKRLETREPNLFLTNVDKEFNAYSRACPYNYRRQPVILTDKEKEKIDKEHPGSYNEAIQYGTDESNKYWYICPRYWSLKHNTSLTEEEVASGKYGNVIPHKSNKVPKGANVYEFTDDKYHKDKDNKYINLYPGFLKDKAHPEGLCVPCCFKSWDAPEQTKRRGQCLTKNVEKQTKQKDKKQKKQKITLLEEEQGVEEHKEGVEEEGIEGLKTTSKERETLSSSPEPVSQPQPQPQPQETDIYIKNPEKFPLETNRWGYLPIAVQKFLRTDNKKCYISNTNTNLKANHPCLLRQGVEINKYQSFIACIANVFTEEINETLTIKDMKDRIINSINIDLFMTYNNGNLIQIFKNDHIEVDARLYKKSNLFKSLDLRNDKEKILMANVISAYETFIEYLKDDETIINHNYLWDIISKPNPKLFPKGLNLIILDLEKTDITDNIRLLCPTNNYSNDFFDSNKKCVLLLKIENYYEPIYILEDQVKQWNLQRTFSLKNKSLLPNLKDTLELIKYSFFNKCIGFNSMPSVYKFKKNIYLADLIKQLETIGYKVLEQVLNFNGKIIGVLTKNKDNIKGFLPCYPSSPVDSLKEIIMSDVEWNDFQTTFDFLLNASKDSNKKILSLPKIKVLENQLIIGILTETDQFISIQNPQQNTISMDMPVIESSDYNNIDSISLTKHSEDKDREKYIKQIQIESNFYISFRNTIRILLGQYRNRKIKQEIEDIIDSRYLLYNNKIKKLIGILNHLSKKYISFINYKKGQIKDLVNISTCLLNQECNKPFCKINNEDERDPRENKICKLNISKTNLINGQNNEEVYYTRIADELVRYTRIKYFILDPKSILSFKNIDYNVSENEIIILNSLLTQDYFEDLVPTIDNKYIKYSTYDNVKPNKSIVYNNEIDRLIKINEPEFKDDDVSCKTERTDTVGGKLKKFLPKKTIEMLFDTETPLCTFEIIETIINDHIGKKIVNKKLLKEQLIEEYEKYNEYLFEITDILNKQGKKFALQVQVGQITMQDMIISNDYYATNLDIWVLARKYNVPLIFLSGTKLNENDRTFLVVNSDGSDKYYFIKSPGVTSLKLPKYRLYITENQMKISLTSFSSEIQNDIRLREQELSLNNYIEQFSSKKIRKPKKAKTKLKLILEEEEIKKPKKRGKIKLVLEDEPLE